MKNDIKEVNEGITEYHRNYRPKDLEEVVGHEQVVKSLSGFQDENRWPHSFLFSGPSGVGKTTFARIIATVLDAEMIEVDAATYSGVENVRNLTNNLRYKPMDPTTPNRVIIVDECHSLSKAAWQALLKNTEEPPDFAYFILCTTEPAKVPKTIKTRCHSYDLKPVDTDDIYDLLVDVSAEEELDFEGHQLETIAEASEGSPRQALVYLSQCVGFEDEDMEIILSQPSNDPEVIDFCRALAKSGLTWESAMTMVKGLEKKYTAESVRIVVINYFSRVAIGSKKLPEGTLSILEAFSGEWRQEDKYAPLLLSIGELLY